jgi:hypothetical protein
MQPKGAIERERTVGGARRRYRQLAMQIRVIAVAVGRHGRQTIQCAAQNHDNKARRTARLCK